MSLRVITSRLLAISPKCWMAHGQFHSRTHLGVTLIALGLSHKHIVVDPDAQLVTIHRRLAWLFRRSQTIAFDEVARIDYSCRSIPTGIGLLGVTNEFDRFRVDLELHDRTLIHLWTFYGEGSVQTGWGGVLFGDDATFDLAGDQEDASERFSRVLSVMMEKPRD